MLGIQLVPFGVALVHSHAIRGRGEQLEIRFRKLTPLAEILPGYLGSPLKGELDLTGPIAFAENFNQRTGGYIGAIALLAILIVIPRSSPALWVAGGAFLLALAVPGLAHVLKYVPLVNWVAFEYFQVAFVLFAAALAGIAIQQLAKGIARPALGKIVIAVGAALFIGGVIPLAAPRMVERAARQGVVTLQQRGYLHQPASVYEQRIAAYVDAARVTAFRRGSLPALCWIVAGAALTMRASRKRETLLACAAIGELVVFAYGYNPAIRVDEIAREPRAIAEIKQRDPAGQWLVASSNDVFPPNLGTTFGVRQSHAYDILTSERETRALLPSGYDPAHWALSPQPTAEQKAALAARGVRYFVTTTGVIELPKAIPPPRPRNDPPRGIVIGAIVSALGIAIAIFVRYSHSIVLGGFDETS
jgi:hypothetical protein